MVKSLTSAFTICRNNIRCRYIPIPLRTKYALEAFPWKQINRGLTKCTAWMAPFGRKEHTARSKPFLLRN